MTARSYNEYINADGLYIRKGRGEAELGRGGEYSLGGGRHLVEIDLVATDLKAHNDSTDPTTVLDYNVRIPPGVFLERAEVQVTTDFVGASATLDIGLVKASDLAAAFTDLDDDGIDSAVAVTALQIDDTMPIVCDGALISTTLGTDDGGYLVSAEAGTASFTAGVAKVRIWYSVKAQTATS